MIKRNTQSINQRESRKRRLPKKVRKSLSVMDAQRYLTILQSARHPVINLLHRLWHLSGWLVRLLVPDFLIGHPNLWDNLKTLRKNPKFKPLRGALIAWLIFSIFMSSAGFYSLKYASQILAATFVDDTQGEFDAGTYSDTQYDVGNTWVELDATGLLNGAGNYTSTIFDAGNPAAWNSIAWTPQRPSGKELPDSAGTETAYTTGNTDMTGNMLLLHADEASGAIADTSGNGYNGTYNGALYGQAGQVNDALGLDGINDFISLPKTMSIRGLSNFTAAGWVYFNNLSAVQVFFMECTDNAVDSDTCTGRLRLDATTAGAVRAFYNNVSTGSNTVTLTSADSAVTAGQWYHLAVSMQSGSQFISVNGVQVDTDTIVYAATQNTEPVYNPVFGKNFGAATPTFLPGKVDEMAVWSRALSSTEILDIYKRGVLRFKAQARSCNDAACSGESFIGPDGTAGTYYEWGTTNSISTPSFTLTNISDNQYFQYQLSFESDDGALSPELTGVTVDYDSLIPNTPTNTTPTNGATAQDLNVTLVGSAYSDPFDAPHTDTDWEVDDDSNFATPVWTRTAGLAETTTSVTGGNGTFANELAGKTELDHNTVYYWRVRYSNGYWSAWSTGTSFTANLNNAPTNSSPANLATLTSTTTPLLTASAFDDDQTGHTHAATQWLVDNDSDFASLTWDTGETESGETSRAVQAGILNNFTTYYWKVRYKDSSGFWSAYSTATSFDIQVVQAAVEVRPIFGNTTVDQGDTVKIDAQIINLADGSSIDDATVTLNVYSPAGAQLVTGGSMTYIAGSLGLYRYSYDIPATSGSYVYEVTATSGTKSGYGAANFEVRTIQANITTVITNVTQVQNQVQAGLLDMPKNVKSGNTILIKYRAATGLSGAGAPKLNVYDASDVQRVTNGAMTEIGATGVYSASVTLDAGWSTGYFTVIAGESTNSTNDEAQLFVGNDDLASIGSNVSSIKTTVEGLNDLTAADVWAAANRSLTDPDTIWEYALTSIGDIGSVGKLIKDNLDAAVSSRGTSDLTAADVWAAATRTLTASDNFNDPSTATIATAVWAEANRTLTDYGNDITAAEVWEVLTSTLTTVGSIGKQTTEDLTTVKNTTNTLNTNVDVLLGSMVVTQSTVNDASATTTGFVTALTNATDDFYNNAVLTFTDGGLNGQSRRISDYNGTTKAVTLSPALTSAPANGNGFTIVKQNVYVEEQVAEHETAQAVSRTRVEDIQTKTTDIQTKVTDIQSTVNDIKTTVDSAYTLLQTVDTKIDTVNTKADTLITNLQTVDDQVDAIVAKWGSATAAEIITDISAVQTTVDSIRAAQQLNYRVRLSDNDGVAIGNDYRATLTILDYDSQPVNAASTPSITLYDAERATAETGDLTQLSTGVYEYIFTVPDDATQGVWESVVSTDLGGVLPVVTQDYWTVNGSPAQVLINGFSDLSVPSIAASVTITNEGVAGNEYQYEWCVVTAADNSCGGGDDVFYSLAAKYIQAGDDFDTTLAATVTQTGTYYFKVIVYFGTEASGAAQSFTAVIMDDETLTPVIGTSGSITVSNINTVADQLEVLKTELGYSGKTKSTFQDLRLIQSWLGALPGQNAQPLYLELANISKSLQELKTLSLIDFEKPAISQILETSEVNAADLQELKNKLADLRALSSITRRLLEQEVAEPVVESWLTFDSVVFNFIISNPLEEARQFKFKSYLPTEVRPEHILKLDGLRLDYDANAASYYIYDTLTLAAKESLTKKVEVQDIWLIDNITLDNFISQAVALVKPLDNTHYEAQGVILQNEINTLVSIIRAAQKQARTPQDHIVAYRANLQRLQTVETSLNKLKDIVTQTGVAKGMVGQIGGIQTFAVWGIVLAVLFGFSLMSIIIFAMWRQQNMWAMAFLGLQKNESSQLLKPSQVLLPRQQLQPSLFNAVTAATRTPSIVTAEHQVTSSATKSTKSHHKKALLLIILTIFGAITIFWLFNLLNSFISIKTSSNIKGPAPMPAVVTTPLDDPFSTQDTIQVITDNQIDTDVTTPAELPVVPSSITPTTKRFIKVKNLGGYRLNIRQEPSLDAAIIGKAISNEQLPYLQTENGWYRIILPNQSVGWVSGLYIDTIID